ncbi:MAG: hypothetical protein HYZ72_10005 [Deltaproteobacteria bacterium]|nr:hypothetical protein [Deltaproteobacteria bacterium]
MIPSVGNRGNLPGGPNVAMFLGNGDGSLAPSFPAVDSFVDETPYALKAADFDKDGNLDLLWLEVSLSVHAFLLSLG